MNILSYKEGGTPIREKRVSQEDQEPTLYQSYQIQCSIDSGELLSDNTSRMYLYSYRSQISCCTEYLLCWMFYQMNTTHQVN